MEEIKKAFEDSIDDYLDFCNGRGEIPSKKTYSGRVLLRVNSSLYNKLVNEASRRKISLNQLVTNIINKSIVL